MRIVAVGSPKGGTGKTTTAVTVATIAAKTGMSVLLVDCDANRSARDWCERSEDFIPVDITDGRDPATLRRLRMATGYDLAVLDLPGAREDSFEAVLTGEGGQPVADMLVMPSAPEVMDLRPLVRVIQAEVMPLGLRHMIVFTRVATEALRRAGERQAELRSRGLNVAETVIRRLVAYDEAVERSRTVLDIGGAHSYARVAEGEYRHLTAEVLKAVGLNTEVSQ
jgi:chromosome partitioning protein